MVALQEMCLVSEVTRFVESGLNLEEKCIAVLYEDPLLSQGLTSKDLKVMPLSFSLIHS